MNAPEHILSCLSAYIAPPLLRIELVKNQLYGKSPLGQGALAYAPVLVAFRVLEHKAGDVGRPKGVGHAMDDLL